MEPIQEGFFEEILEHLHDCVFVCDPNGIVLYVNKTFERYYGIRREEITGEQGINFFKNNVCTASPIPIVVEKKKTVTMEQHTYVNRTVVITAVPVFDQQGKIKMIVEDSRDITEIDQLKASLKQEESLKEQYKEAFRQYNAPKKLPQIATASKAMREIMQRLIRISLVDSTILLQGETGTGKTTIAKYIHSISKRREGPFISINCSTIPESLFESELFGYLPGTFTGASKNGKIGLVELANGGTLFLDEIGDMPLQSQTKLLQVVQEHRFLPLGASKERDVDVRIISATHLDLRERVRERKFREDLYFRLKVVEFEIPPLRERLEDLTTLVYAFLNYFDKKYSFSHSISPDVMNCLCQYTWPGNIRELQNLIENLVVVVEDPEIQLRHLPPNIHPPHKDMPRPSQSSDLKATLEEMERTIILASYDKHKSTYKVAQELGVSQSTVMRRLRKYGALINENAEDGQR